MMKETSGKTGGRGCGKRILIIMLLFAPLLFGTTSAADASWLGSWLAKIRYQDLDTSVTNYIGSSESVPVLPLPETPDMTGIANRPDSSTVVEDASEAAEQENYIRTTGSGAAADTLKLAGRFNNLVKGSWDSMYVCVRSDSACAVIKVIVTLEDMAGNVLVTGTATPSVNDTWSRFAFPFLLEMDAEEVKLTYLIITAAARYVDITPARLKEAQ
jgi:hypothetical protein